MLHNERRVRVALLRLQSTKRPPQSIVDQIGKTPLVAFYSGSWSWSTLLTVGQWVRAKIHLL